MVEIALKKEAEGTFLWVSLMVIDLEKEPKYNVKHKLKEPPQGLNKTYSRILNENIPSEAREDVQFLLLSMVAARRPLEIEEIASAFAVWKDGTVLSGQNVDEYTDISSLDVQDREDRSPLSWAAKNGHEAIIRLLLATGKVEPDSRDKAGRSPLCWTIKGSNTLPICGAPWKCGHNHKAVAKLLLSTGNVEFVAGVTELLGTDEAVHADI
ncbi:hypothetical protein VE03_04699 [Pseudogymnoascus sp. 23342-1-I1]|nr:hypothetical protein VE03_04699 [Pseudogymnoascus sp. 23342-1-I1]